MRKIVLLSTLLLAAAPALASTPPTAPKEVRIPRMSHFLEWKADADRGLWIRGDTGKWYYARVEGRCPRLNTAGSIRFNTGPGGNFDRKSSVRAEGWLCHIDSVTESGPPPGRDKR